MMIKTLDNVYINMEDFSGFTIGYPNDSDFTVMAMKELVDQGLIKGEKLGIEKEKKNTIIRMLKFGLDDNDISTLSDVPLATVKEIRLQITVD